MRVTFHGATDTVTGSQTLVSTPATRLIVDCGMYQGFRRVRERNRAAPACPPASLDAVVITHAHLDHSGLLPRLVKHGFAGEVVCTPATADLLRIVLLDSAFLQEEDARRASRWRDQEALEPLYTAEDVERTLGLVRTRAMDAEWAVGDLTGRFVPVGHMLGAASVRLEHEGRVALFSGDVGREDDVLMRAPRPFEGADLLVVESTYGDRLHEPEDSAARLEAIVHQVCGRGGVLMIPAFAIGRSQAVLHLLADLREHGRIPDLPIFLNSPMAIDSSDIFCRHPEGHRLTPQECRRMCSVARYMRSADQSKELNRRGGPMILLAGSGMATGGRILHHLKRFGGDARNGVLLVGFQARGTRGAQLADGAETLRIHGRDYPIRAERFRMHGLSGHADWQELITWLSGAPRPDKIRINHGEPGSTEALRVRLADELDWRASIARRGDVIDV